MQARFVTGLVAAAYAAGLVGSLAHGEPFSLLYCNGGGELHQAGGLGFVTEFGGFFVAEGAGTDVGAGVAAAFTAANEHEFDSHFGLTGFGPAARNRIVNPADNSHATLGFYGDYGSAGGPTSDYNEGEDTPGYFYFTAGIIGDPLGEGAYPESLARGWIGLPGFRVRSYFAPRQEGGRGSRDGVFAGRFAVQRGSAISCRFIASSIVESTLQFWPADLVLGGPGVEVQTSSGLQRLALRSFLIAQVDIQSPSSATFAGAQQGDPFGPADVYDLWVQAVPPPRCQGDSNADGVVDFSDITTVLLHWGVIDGTFDPANGDANGDGLADFSDVTTILQHFTTLCD